MSLLLTCSNCVDGLYRGYPSSPLVWTCFLDFKLSFWGIPNYWTNLHMVPGWYPSACPVFLFVWVCLLFDPFCLANSMLWSVYVLWSNPHLVQPDSHEQWITAISLNPQSLNPQHSGSRMALSSRHCTSTLTSTGFDWEFLTHAAPELENFAAVEAVGRVLSYSPNPPKRTQMVRYKACRWPCLLLAGGWK